MWVVPKYDKMARAGRNKFGGTELYFVAHMTLQLLIMLNAEWLFKVPLWNTTRGHKWIFAAATGKNKMTITSQTYPGPI